MSRLLATILCSLVFFGGCSATNKKYATTLPSPPTASTASIATKATAPSITLMPEVTDGYGNRPKSATWELVSSTGANVILQTDVNPLTGRSTVTFPTNGTYQLKLIVVNENDLTTTEQHTIEVDVAEAFALVTTVGAGPNATFTPLAGYRAEIEWMPADGVVISSATSNGLGVIQFDDLIGHPTDFQIMIPKS